MTSLLIAVVLSAAPTDDTIFDGAVKAVDARKMTVRIERDSGKVTEVFFDRNSEVRLDGRKADFNAIKVGQEIRCQCIIKDRRVIQFNIYDVTDRP